MGKQKKILATIYPNSEINFGSYTCELIHNSDVYFSLARLQTLIASLPEGHFLPQFLSPGHSGFLSYFHTYHTTSHLRTITHTDMASFLPTCLLFILQIIIQWLLLHKFLPYDSAKIRSFRVPYVFPS